MIPLIRPYVQFNEVKDAFEDIFSSGILTSGEHVKSFERKFADYIGVKYAFTTTSATTALSLCLATLGVGKGDEILVSDFTFPATGNVIAQTGAKPVLIDCESNNFSIDVNLIESKITKKTVAIMPVDPFGIPADMESIVAISDKNGLTVIEDAACAVGSKISNKLCGSWPGMGCFSFHPRKLVTTGEGGMITTDNDHFSKKINILRNHGGVRNGNTLSFLENGFNFRLSEPAAAMGVAQINNIRSILEDRKRIAQAYIQKLSENELVSIPSAYIDSNCNFQSFVIMLDKNTNRNFVISDLRSKGIETTLGTYAMHAQPSFRKFGYTPKDLPNSWVAQEHSLTLPMPPHMDNSDIDYVVSALNKTLTSTDAKS